MLLALGFSGALAGMSHGIVLMVAVAGAAALIPALRAARADPVQALRAE